MMRFWDTSAVVPLLLHEAGTKLVAGAFDGADDHCAWRWMRVETEASLTRRCANAAAWMGWESLATEFTWVDIRVEDHPSLLAFNRKVGLRAADAAHLFCAMKVAQAVPEMVLVSLDEEMLGAARKLKLRVWKAER